MDLSLETVKYKDLFNDKYVYELKKSLEEVVLFYNKLFNKDAIEARESDMFTDYTSQYSKDVFSLRGLRNSAQKISDLSNNAIYDIVERGIKYHIFENPDFE